MNSHSHLNYWLFKCEKHVNKGHHHISSNNIITHLVLFITKRRKKPKKKKKRNPLVATKLYFKTRPNRTEPNNIAIGAESLFWFFKLKWFISQPNDFIHFGFNENQSIFAMKWFFSYLKKSLIRHQPKDLQWNYNSIINTCQSHTHKHKQHVFLKYSTEIFPKFCETISNEICVGWKKKKTENECRISDIRITVTLDYNYLKCLSILTKESFVLFRNRFGVIEFVTCLHRCSHLTGNEQRTTGQLLKRVYLKCRNKCKSRDEMRQDGTKA